MSRPKFSILITSLLYIFACGVTEQPSAELLFPANAAGIEVLLEERELAGPSADTPNRFYQGWRPFEVSGRRAYQAVHNRATFQVVTLTPRPRDLVLDLAMMDEVSRAGHFRVWVDGVSQFLVPPSNPLSVVLPENLPPGRHLVEISPTGSAPPPFVVYDAAIRPVADQGKAQLQDGILFQSGPSIVDVVSEAKEGWTLVGQVCPQGAFPSTDGHSVQLTSVDDHDFVQWTGTSTFLDRFRGCREVTLSPLPVAGPVRVRFQVRENASTVAWQNWRWLPLSSPPAAPSSGAVAQPPRSPRLVVIYVMDALRSDTVPHLGGPPSISPTIDRLAKEGFLFRDHRSTAPNTLLSVRHLFTGHLLINRRTWNTLGADSPSLAEEFQAAGYRTGLFSGNGYLSEAFGLTEGFDHVSREALFEGSPDQPNQVNRNAARVHAAALNWLDSLSRNEKIFLHLQTIHPHNPYAPPPDLERRLCSRIPSDIQGNTQTLISIGRGRLPTSEADRNRLRCLYQASVAYNDAELDRFLDELEIRIDKKDMLLFFTSDHGEELFDHGGVLHGYTLYEEQLRVPLVAWAPGLVRPGQTEQVTDALDLHATLIDLVGRTQITRGSGRSLLGLLTGFGERIPPKIHFSVSDGVPGGAFALRFGRWKYIWVRGTHRSWSMGLGPGRSWDREYLFDLQTDPIEKNNLAGFDSVREQYLRVTVRSWVQEMGAEPEETETPAHEREIDESERRRLRALGYIE